MRLVSIAKSVHARDWHQACLARILAEDSGAGVTHTGLRARSPGELLSSSERKVAGWVQPGKDPAEDASAEADEDT